MSIKKILVISGKGGTGKTVLSAALSSIADSLSVADCDVDAANLHLLLNPKIYERGIFKNRETAYINKDLCIECGKCIEVCRFDAISENFIVDKISCEGCGFCWNVCPVNAIKKEENISGNWFLADSKVGKFAYARLSPGEENSGKLVSIVKKKIENCSSNNEFLIIDGPPGIGCPVISSISGMDFTVIVTEPTISGLHDAERVLKLANHFKIKSGIVINKYDLNEEYSKKIEQFAKEKNVNILGKIPFDKCVIDSVINGKTIFESENCDNIKKIIYISKLNR